MQTLTTTLFESHVQSASSFSLHIFLVTGCSCWFWVLYRTSLLVPEKPIYGKLLNKRESTLLKMVAVFLIPSATRPSIASSILCPVFRCQVGRIQILWLILAFQKEVLFK